VAVFSHEGEARMQPGRDRTPAFTGSSNTRPSDATLRNISQNMYWPTAARSDCASAGCTRPYCNVTISRVPSLLGPPESLLAIGARAERSAGSASSLADRQVTLSGRKIPGLIMRRSISVYLIRNRGGAVAFVSHLLVIK